MSAPQEPVVLADTGGLLVTDDGRRVLVMDRRTSGLTTSAFVLGVITLVVGGFGVVAFIAGTPSGATGAIFLVVGLLFAVLTFLLVTRIRRRRNQPLNQCRPVAVIDRKLGLFSYRGGALVQLDQVRFARKFQLGSSSPKLVAETPGGTLVLKRGNPFDGGVETSTRSSPQRRTTTPSASRTSPGRGATGHRAARPRLRRLPAPPSTGP